MLNIFPKLFTGHSDKVGIIVYFLSVVHWNGKIHQPGLGDPFVCQLQFIFSVMHWNGKIHQMTSSFFLLLT